MGLIFAGLMMKLNSQISALVLVFVLFTALKPNTLEAQRLYSVEIFKGTENDSLQNPIERYLSNLPNGCLVEGSFFDPDEFFPAKIVLKGNTTGVEEYVRFNWLRDQLEVLNGRDTVVYRNPEVVSYVESKGRVFVYLPYVSRKNERLFGWFEEIANGSFSLLLKRKVKLQRLDYLSPVIASLTDHDKIDIITTWYLREGDLDAVPFRLNKRNLAALWPDSRDLLLDYISENNVKGSDHQSLKRYFGYLNSITPWEKE